LTADDGVGDSIFFGFLCDTTGGTDKGVWFALLMEVVVVVVVIMGSAWLLMRHCIELEEAIVDGTDFVLEVVVSVAIKLRHLGDSNGCSRKDKI